MHCISGLRDKRSTNSWNIMYSLFAHLFLTDCAGLVCFASRLDMHLKRRILDVPGPRSPGKHLPARPPTKPLVPMSDHDEEEGFGPFGEVVEGRWLLACPLRRGVTRWQHRAAGVAHASTKSPSKSLQTKRGR
jgi:hypothetical protein